MSTIGQVAASRQRQMPAPAVLGAEAPHGEGDDHPAEAADPDDLEQMNLLEVEAPRLAISGGRWRRRAKEQAAAALQDKPPVRGRAVLFGFGIAVGIGLAMAGVVVLAELAPIAVEGAGDGHSRPVADPVGASANTVASTLQGLRSPPPSSTVATPVRPPVPQEAVAAATSTAAIATTTSTTAAGAAATTTRGKASVGYRWHHVARGGETHMELGQLLEDYVNREGYDKSSEGYAALDLLTPEPQRCNCRLLRFDQYAVCANAFTKASKAISLGVNGYDHWGNEVSRNHNIVPDLYDCYNQKKPGGFKSRFFPVCVGTKGGLINKKNFTTLQVLLQDAEPNSVLLKMDIEESEFGVLGSLTDEEYSKILSLHVEYHFNLHGVSPEEMRSAAKVFKQVRDHLAVVDGAGGFYGGTQMVGGVGWPKLMAVSYSALSACGD